MMKLGVNFNCFDGVELLPYNIKQLRDSADFIMVHYQTESWYGSPIKKEYVNILTELKKQGWIDHLLNYKTEQKANNPYEAKLLERDKRNKSRLFCLHQKQCTHFLELDVDEFFKKDEFKNAKQLVVDNDYQYTAVKLIDYFNLPIYQRKTLNSCMIPFICKLDENKQLGAFPFFGKTDPTRAYSIKPYEKNYLFDIDKISCHHMAGVRSDLLLKYAATSRGKLDRNRIPEIIENIKSITTESIEKGTIQNKFGNIGNEFKVVDNIFGIPLELFQ